MGNVMAVASGQLSIPQNTAEYKNVIGDSQNGYTEFLVDSTKAPSDRNIFEQWLQDVFDRADNNHYRKRACCTGSLHRGIGWRQAQEHTHGIEIPIANLWSKDVAGPLGVSLPTTSYPVIGPNPGVTNPAASYVTEGYDKLVLEIASVNSTARANDLLVLGKNGFTLRRLPFDQYEEETPAKLKELCAIGSRNYQRMIMPSGSFSVTNGYNVDEVNDTTDQSCTDLYRNVCSTHANNCKAGTVGNEDLSITGLCGADKFPTHKKLNIAYQSKSLPKERIQALNYPLDCGCTNSMAGNYWNQTWDVFGLPVVRRRPKALDEACRNQMDGTHDGGLGFTSDREIGNIQICENNLKLENITVAGSMFISNINLKNVCNQTELDAENNATQPPYAAPSPPGAAPPGAAPPGAGPPGAAPPVIGPNGLPIVPKKVKDDDSDQMMMMMMMMMVVVVVVVVVINKKKNNNK